jgi:hypothetical protein
VPDNDVITTSRAHLELAAEHIRYAMHADPPRTPTEVYDLIGALHTITSRLEQHLDRCARALTKAAESPELAASDDDPDPAFTARQAAYRLTGTASERLAGMVAELATTWTQVSALYIPVSTDDVADDDVVHAEILPADWPEDDNGRLPAEKE